MREQTFEQRIVQCVSAMNQAAWRIGGRGADRLKLSDIAPWVAGQVEAGHGEVVCPYCGVVLDSMTTAFDHVVPLSRDGTNTLDNLAMVCRRCNWYKASMTGAEWSRLVDALRAAGQLDRFFALYRPWPRRIEVFEGLATHEE